MKLRICPFIILWHDQGVMVLSCYFSSFFLFLFLLFFSFFSFYGASSSSFPARPQLLCFSESPYSACAAKWDWASRTRPRSESVRARVRETMKERERDEQFVREKEIRGESMRARKGSFHVLSMTSPRHSPLSDW